MHYYEVCGSLITSDLNRSLVFDHSDNVLGHTPNRSGVRASDVVDQQSVASVGILQGNRDCIRRGVEDDRRVLENRVFEVRTLQRLGNSLEGVLDDP